MSIILTALSQIMELNGNKAVKINLDESESFNKFMLQRKIG